MKNFMEKALNIFFPKKLKCMFCGRDIDYKNKPYCDFCEKEKFFNNSKSRCKICDMPIVGEVEYCDNCKQNHKSFDKAFCPFIYEGNVRKSLLKFKSQNAKYLAEPMAKIMAEKLIDENLEFDIIIPIPMTEKSLKKRGYNQALLLAEEISKILNKPLCTDVLFKTRDTKHQKELGFNDRQKNLAGAFGLENIKKIKGKNILLVDDILTTCATVDSCSSLLKKYSNNVYVCCFARNIYKKQNKIQ